MSDSSSEKITPAADVDRLTDHSYDGIQEYDNPLPGWWTWLFVATIFFSVVYFYIGVTTGQLSGIYTYNQQVAEDTRRQFGSRPLTPDAATIITLAKDDKFRSMGEKLFQANCVSCHGRHAEGLVCPNLTDDYYINIRKVEDFVDVITHGRNNGAMPAWGNRLAPNDIIVVASYVASLRGTTYVPGKAPEANAIVPPPWTTEPEASH